MGGRLNQDSGCGCFGGWSSKNSDEHESYVVKSSSFGKKQHEEPKKTTSENVAEQHPAVEGGLEDKTGLEVDRKHKASDDKEDGENVDKEAEDFIGRMKAAIKAERLKSMKRFQSMLNRGT